MTQISWRSWTLINLHFDNSLLRIKCVKGGLLLLIKTGFYAKMLFRNNILLTLSLNFLNHKTKCSKNSCALIYYDKNHDFFLRAFFLLDLFVLILAERQSSRDNLSLVLSKKIFVFGNKLVLEV